MAFETAARSNPTIITPVCTGAEAAKTRAGRYARLRPLLSADHVRHSDKVRQGPGAHLAHDRSTVNFDGNLTDSKVAGYLFVQLSHRDQLHYLLLARRQRLKPLPHLRTLAVDGALLPVEFYGCPPGTEHILIIEWL